VVVALSASAFSEGRDHLLAAGCAEFVRKPFREAEIFEVMQRQLGLEYLYEGEPGEAPAPMGDEQQAALMAASLPHLPGELRKRLLDALAACDMAEVDAAVQAMAAIDGELSELLVGYTADFRYAELIDLLERKEGGAD
jgi:hypothetical protein